MAPTAKGFCQKSMSAASLFLYVSVNRLVSRCTWMRLQRFTRSFMFLFFCRPTCLTQPSALSFLRFYWMANGFMSVNSSNELPAMPLPKSGLTDVTGGWAGSVSVAVSARAAEIVAAFHAIMVPLDSERHKMWPLCWSHPAPQPVPVISFTVCTKF